MSCYCYIKYLLKEKDWAQVEKTIRTVIEYPASIKGEKKKVCQKKERVEGTIKVAKPIPDSL